AQASGLDCRLRSIRVMPARPRRSCGGLARWPSARAARAARLARSPGSPGSPGTITDLAVAAVTGDSVALAFTEVDDGTGRSASYDFRYSVAPISWGSALAVTRGSCATPVTGTTIGAHHRCTVLGLTIGTSYQF